MKTNAKLFTLALAVAATMSSAAAQQFVARVDAGIAAANKGPYDGAGGTATFYFGRTLDPAGQSEVTVSIGGVAWGESDIDRSRNSENGTTTMWIDEQKFAIPSDNTHFSFKDGTMTLDNGSAYKTDYRPELGIVPLMVNYRFATANQDAPVRFFFGAGVGAADLTMQSKLWRRFEYDRSWGWSRHDNDSNWCLTWNATVGVAIRLNRSMTIDANYAFQQFQGSTFNMRNVTYKLDDMNVSMGRVGFTWRF
jgi:opacity protein-like surface antigen